MTKRKTQRPIWTHGMEKMLFRLKDQGLSGAEISRKFLEQGFNFSRSAVIGKLWREAQK